MSLGKKIALNTVYQVIGRIITVIIALVIVVYLTRYLGVEGYGNYTTIIAYLGLFTILADFGFYIVTAKEMSQNPKKHEELFANTLALRALTALVILILADLIIYLMPYPAIVKQGVLIFSVGILAMLLNQVMIIIFQINLSTDKIAWGDVFGRILSLVLVLAAISHGRGLSEIMWASSAGFVLTFLISFFFASRYFKIKLRFDLAAWKRLINQSWPIGVVLILLSFYFRLNTVLLSVIPLDHVILSEAKGISNIEATGLYGPSYRIMDTVTFFPAIFMGIVMPVFAHYLSKSRARAKRVFSLSMEVLIISGVAVAFITFGLSPEIISLLGGEGFARSVPILQISGIYIGTFFVILGINYFIVALEAQKKLLKPYLYALAINLAITPIGIYLFSYYGAIVASVIINLLLLVFGFRILREAHFKIPHSVFQKSLLSGIMLVVSFYLLRQLPLLKGFANLSIPWQFLLAGGMIVIGSLVFLVGLYFLGGISKENLRIIRRQ